MRRKRAAPVFKPYVMNQVALLPPSYDEMIPPGHLVRVVNDGVEKIDVSALLAQNKGGGTSSYHPKMPLKVLVYAYAERIYSSRRIAKALRENIYFMWISGESRPDFRTINAFRGSRMKGVIEQVFRAVLEYLVEEGHVKMEHYFLDGTKIEADANKHKVVWAKKCENYHRRVQEQIKELLKHIEQENEAEQAEYGDDDLEELGGGGSKDVDGELLKKKIDELNQKLREQVWPKKQAQAVHKVVKKLEEDCLVRLEKYEAQEKTLQGRSSFATTDPDASSMRMKEDRGSEKPWPKPAYNVQMGTENQFVVGFSVHGRAGDTSCLIPHLEGMRTQLGRLPDNVVADAGYGSEENYAYLEQHGLGNFVKYNTFYQDTHHYRKPEVIRQHQFRAENFDYDPERDEFICPAQQRLHFQYASRYTTDNGYVTNRRNYECDQRSQCPFKLQCTRAKGNRRIRISFRLLEYRRQARANLTTQAGQRLRAKRSTDVETVFGSIKQNMGFRRFHLRGLEKVKTEWGLVSIAHNMRKLAG
ncbi:MAG TPA: IS1182 family transposase [Anaerolineales bacterium]|nr:IS1182 family transposase [Anaerolineales bacterium]